MQNYLIETKRLGLRFMRREDIEHLRSLDKDPVVKEFFPEGTLTDDEIKAYMNDCMLNCKTKGLPCFVIFKLQTNEFVGEAYFDHLDSGETKVGYLFHQKYWNKGYGTEVLSALLNWAKTYIKADYIIAYADKKNKGSFRVMKNCGMEYYKDEYYLDMECRFYRIKNQ
ncbi:MULTISPECIES: GNAT family N-acetyltransferase [Legionella]|uniref:GNAT family acetyltransferase n=1 Tax=Legionella donaldsonii TaxID=45060 RepID=A0A378J2E2_9GAMM|nr:MULTISPECIES: GNAT family N-acetyltransferase [Legionella]MCC5015516.1 GNAT family N-acetyltransferase [Legionella sp. 31fI33]STX41699.1 GNAT family acetyltransferase [Legionella donaldsonii]